MESKDLALKCAKILSDKIAQDLSVIYVREITSLADYFVIATGNSSTHVKALADEVEFKLKQEEIFPDHIEGHGTNSWIVPARKPANSTIWKGCGRTARQFRLTLNNGMTKRRQPMRRTFACAGSRPLIF